MGRIAILAHPSETLEFVAHALTLEGHHVRLMPDPECSFPEISRFLPELVIVDGAESLADAEQLAIRVQRHQSVERKRVLILLQGEVADTRRFASDAYLVRPLHPHTLIARVTELLAKRATDSPKRYIVVSDLVIDPVSFRVTRAGQLLSLTTSEFRLLYHLASHPNVICRRSALLADIWDNSQTTTDRTIDAFVRQLRKKIERDPGNPSLILTVRNQGYLFSIPQEDTFPAADCAPVALADHG